MFRKAIISAFVFLVGALLISSNYGEKEDTVAPVRGRNNTVLFVTSDHFGFCNVHLATAFALLEKQPDVKVHYASISALESRVKGISARARQRDPTASDIAFHHLPGSPIRALSESISTKYEDDTHKPGVKGIGKLAYIIPKTICPWDADEYYQIYKAIVSTIDEVDPAIIVLDMFFLPGLDATRDRGRLHAIVTPNLLADLMPATQPPHTFLWKYPT